MTLQGSFEEVRESRSPYQGKQCGQSQKLATQIAMGVQYGNRSTEFAGLFDCACGVLEHAADDVESGSCVNHYFVRELY